MGIRRVSVSVYHTDPAVHDRVTRKKGSFQRTLAGIQRLLDRRVEVMIKTPVMDLNAGAEQVMPQFSDDLGTKLDMGVRIRGGNDGSDNLLIRNLDLDEKANVYDCLFAKIKDLSQLPQYGPEDRTCMAGHASAYLSPDGTVQPCLDYEESAGNIRDQSFREIWTTSPLLQHLRGIRRKHFGGCQRCENVSFCGLCPALAARETGQATGSAPSKCRETTAVRYAFERRQANEMDLFRTFGLA
jgi:radical SAM protein with 4Fe4S-binding SPASM domain